MKTSSTMVFLATTALTGALVASGSLQGCRNNDGGGVGGELGSSSSSSTSTGTGGTGGSVTTTTVTIQQIVDPTASGHVGPKTPVKIVGAVAMSTKFLVSKSSSSGSCLWGVFLSAPGLTETAANTGILALSYGTPAVAQDGGTTAYCPVIQANQPAGDAFPDDIKPGDVVDVVGQTDSYIPSTCTAADAGVGYSDVPGIQLSKVTSVNRTSTGATLPKPHVLSTSDLASLAAGSDKTWLGQWGNVKVEADNVMVMGTNGGLTDSYGHMILSDGIQVGDKLYYVGYVKSTDACYSGPVYPTISPTFTAIDAFVYLDYCNWSLVPQDKCHDLNPASDDCAAVADAGADAGAAQVCMH